MVATPVTGSVEVLAVHLVEGESWLEVPCADHDAFAALPAGLSFEGREHGKTGWNSDRGRAFYSSGRTFARAR